jgi:hypothetical protein
MSINGLTVSLAANLRWSFVDDLDLSSTTDSKNLQLLSSKTFGDGVGEANLVWHDIVSVASTLDLSALPKSVFGITGTYTFETLKTVRIRNTGTAAATVTFADCGISSPLTLAPGAVVLLDSDTGWEATGSIVLTGNQPIEVVLIGVGTTAG